MSARRPEDEALILQIARTMQAIAAGKNLEDAVSVGDSGEMDRIRKILRAGSYLPPVLEFTAVELTYARRAFERFHSQPPSAWVSECCRRLTEELLYAV